LCLIQSLEWCGRAWALLAGVEEVKALIHAGPSRWSEE
jgi:hypothetical protein